jgi:hypothetical protein
VKDVHTFMRQFKLYRWEDEKWIEWLGADDVASLLKWYEDSPNKNLFPYIKIEDPDGIVIHGMYNISYVPPSTV